MNSRCIRAAGVATALVFFAGMLGVMLVFSLYLQLGQGFSAIGTGVAMIPWCLGIAVGAGLGNAVLGPKFGRRTLHGGLAVMLLGILGLIATSTDGASAWTLAGPELLAGVGMGAMLSPLSAATAPDGASFFQRSASLRPFSARWPR